MLMVKRSLKENNNKTAKFKVKRIKTINVSLTRIKGTFFAVKKQKLDSQINSHAIYQ